MYIYFKDKTDKPNNKNNNFRKKKLGLNQFNF